MRVRYLCRHPFIYALLYLLAACTNEIEISGDHGMSSETSKIPIDLTAKLAAGENAPVSTVRVIIFSTRSSIPEGPKVLVTNEVIDINNKAKIETYVGYNDIYVIGNEPADLASIKTPQELKAILIQTKNHATLDKAVLFQQLLNVRIKDRNTIYIDGNSTSVSRLDIKLQYVMAKLSVNFDLSTELMGADKKPTNVFFDFKSMEIINIPNHSGLIPQIYKTTQGYTNSPSLALTNNNSTQKDHFQWSSSDIYLPEHLIDNDTHRTELHIKGEINKIAHTYIVPIGDAINSQNSTSAENNKEKWNITRNRHYILNIQSVNRNTESLEISASVTDWVEKNVPIDIPESNFITLIRQEVDVKSLRFPTYVRFASNGRVRIEYPAGLTSNEVKIVPNYNTDGKGGRIDISRGNWFTGDDKSVVVKIISGTASTELKLNFFRTEFAEDRPGKVDWATAMGYPPIANSQIAGFYNRALYRQMEIEKTDTINGCNNYYDPKYKSDDPIRGKGCWRLATIRENQQPEDPNDYDEAWCIEEHDIYKKERAYISARSRTGANYRVDNLKTKYYKYRCVLDVRAPELADFIVSDKDQIDISFADAENICKNMKDGPWKLPNGEQMRYVFYNAGANGLPNNFLADSYWGRNTDGAYIVATMQVPSGIPVTDDMKIQKHAVRCLKSRY